MRGIVAGMDTAILFARVGTTFRNALVAHYGRERTAEMLAQWAAP